MKPGDTFTVEGESYTVLSIAGANVICTRDRDGARCLISLADAKKGN